MSFAVATLLSLTCACIDDKIPEPGEENGLVTTPEIGEPLYAAFKIRIAGEDSNGTRAQGDIVFDKGLDSEKNICLTYDPTKEVPHFILILDENKTNVEKVFPFLLDEDVTKDDKNDEYTGYIKVYEDGGEFKEYVDFDGTRILAVINDGQNLYKTISDNLKKNTTVPLSSLFLQGAKDKFKFVHKEEEETLTYLTMTTSMGVDEDNKKIIALTDDSTLSFHKTIEEAQANAFSLYVERMQAKYTVVFEKGVDTYYLTNENLAEITSVDDRLVKNAIPVNSLFITPSGDENKLKYVKSYTRSPAIDQIKTLTTQSGSWKVNIVGWGVNGLEEDEYYFKQNDIPTSTGSTESDETTETTESFLIDWATQVSDFRYLWAKDAHYSSTDGQYPEQFREVWNYSWDSNNNRLISTQDKSIKNYENRSGDYTLKYLPYDSFTGRYPIEYTTENTFDNSVLGEDYFASKSYIRVGSHLIVACQLLIDGIDNSILLERETVNPQTGLAENNIYTCQTKLLMNDIYWSLDAYKAYATEYLGYFMLTKQNKKIIGPNDGYIYKNKKGVRADGENFELAPAKGKGNDDRVYIKPKDGRILYRYNPEIKSENDEDKYFVIPHEQLEYLALSHDELMAQCFTEGRMYYVAATKHNPNANKTAIAVGDYGTVRNNWYNFIVQDIKKVGTPVHDYNQAIVPNNDHSGSALGIGVNLKPWHYIYEDVDVEGQPRPGQSPAQTPGSN